MSRAERMYWAMFALIGILYLGGPTSGFFHVTNLVILGVAYFLLLGRINNERETVNANRTH